MSCTAIADLRVNLGDKVIGKHITNRNIIGNKCIGMSALVDPTKTIL